MYKKKDSIILIGFMGCGKSTVGIKLSWKEKIPLIDTDKLIEHNTGMSVSDIFEKMGETAFRDLETNVLKELCKQIGTRIISTGGGTPVRPQNRELLRECGIVVYLRITPASVYERLQGDTTRPLLQCEKPLERIQSLMESRQEAYEECAHIIVDVDNLSSDEVLEKIQEGIANYEKAFGN